MSYLLGAIFSQVQGTDRGGGGSAIHKDYIKVLEILNFMTSSKIALCHMAFY